MREISAEQLPSVTLVVFELSATPGALPAGWGHLTSDALSGGLCAVLARCDAISAVLLRLRTWLPLLLLSGRVLRGGVSA